MGNLWSNELELKKIELEREKEITKRETEKEITKRMELELEKERYLGEQFCCACCLQSQD
jgi:hypothetical protein